MYYFLAPNILLIKETIVTDKNIPYKTNHPPKIVSKCNNYIDNQFFNSFRL